MARYDGFADWYDRDFLGEAQAPEPAAAIRLLGRGQGRLLDLGFGTGAKTVEFRDVGWQVTGADISDDMLRLARERGLNVLRADATALPFKDASFDAVVSHFVYTGAHRCLIGPHSRFMYAEGIPELHPGYLDEGRYGLEAAGVGSEEGLRAKVGAMHLTLGSLLQSFLDADLTLECFEELRLEGRRYPFAIVLRWRR